MPDWNDIGMTGLSLQENVFDLKNSAGNSADRQIRIFQNKNASYFNNVADNYNKLINGVFPDPALRYSAYVTGKGVIYIENLNQNKAYELIIHGGRAGSGSRVTHYTVNGLTQTLECINNTENTVTYSSLVPQNSIIEIELVPGGTWGYINAIVLKEFSGLSNARVNLNSFRNRNNNKEVNRWIKIYPNPVGGGFLTIELPEKHPTGIYKIQIMDLNGKILKNIVSEKNLLTLS